MIGRVLGDLLADFKVAVRAVRHAPLFAVIVVGTLGVGIGVNTSMFSVVDAVILRPLSYADSERIVMVGIRTPQYGTSTYGVRSDEYFALKDSVDAFEAIGVYDYGGGTLTGDGGHPEEPTSLSIETGFQEILGLEPLIGRKFTDEDCAVGHEKVLMIGEEMWRRRYNADPEIVGSTILLDEVAHEIVGVVPDSFRFPDESGAIQVFLPRELSPEIQWYSLGLIARLKPGVNEIQADEQLMAIAAGLEQQAPDTNEDRGFYAVSLQETVVGNVQTPLMLLWGAVGFVLLLACMNAANLLLARSATKTHEVVVCSAIGAPRYRIIQRVLCESTLLAVLAGLLGLLIAQWGVEGVARLGMTDLPRSDQIGIDGRVFAFTAVMALATGLMYGILPGWQLSRLDLAEMIKDSGRTSIGRFGQRIRAALTVGEVAIACVLLIGAGLMIRSSLERRATDPGFVYQNVLGLTMWADSPRDADESWRVRFYDEILGRIEAVPGVRSASMISGMPWFFMFDESAPVTIEDHPDFADGEPAMTKFRVVSEDYLQSLEVPLHLGRYLTAGDDPDAPRSTVVSRAFADRYWPGDDPVGNSVMLQSRDEAFPLRIVGVVGDVRERRLDAEPELMLYVPFRQSPRINMTVMVRTDADPLALERQVQQAVWSAYPTQGIWRVSTLEDLLRSTMARERLYTSLLVIFAVVAVLLAAVGIYGVISFSVAQRTREIGIRMALGARNSRILLRVLGDGLRLSAIGLLAGLPVGFWLTRFFEDRLYGVQMLDPMTYAAVSLVVMIIAMAACFLPAHRATRVHPMTCLAAE